MTLSLALALDPSVQAVELFGVEGLPEPLQRSLSLEERTLVVAVSAEGDRAAVAVDVTDPGPKARGRTELQVFDASGKSSSLDLDGRSRALIFSRDGERLVALQHRPDRRGPPETELVQVGVGRMELLRTLHAPLTARGLAYWPERALLLVIGEDEIRGYHEGDLSSGPVWRIPGSNHAAVSLGGSRFVLGGASGLATVDLSDPAQDHAIPLRERLATDAVDQLTVTRAPARLLARSADSAIFEVELAPLGRGNAIGSGWLAQWPVPPASFAAAVRDPEASIEAAPPLPAVVTDSSAETASGTAPAAPAAHTEGSDEASDERPSVPPPLKEPPGGFPDIQIAGTLFGPAAEHVVAVVVLGPEDISKEAQRVLPARGGRWTVRDLAPGRYRIVLDGGPRLLSTSPSFHSVTVERGGRPLLLEFEVLDSR